MNVPLLSRLLSILAAATLLALPAVAQTTTAAADASAQATGTKIGTIISAAVTTAFPPLKIITDLIWPPRDGKANTSSVTAKAAQPAIEAKVAASATAQKTNAATLDGAAADLIILRSFVTECGFASMKIAAMQKIVANAPPGTLSATTKALLTDEWTPAALRLDTLTPQAISAQIDKMSDNFLKSSVGLISDSILNNSKNITNQIAAGRASALQASLADLLKPVASVAPLAGVLIGDLSTSLKKAAADIPGKAGAFMSPTEKKAAEDSHAANIKVLQTLYGSKLKLK
jgi:hypothetical protein